MLAPTSQFQDGAIAALASMPVERLMDTLPPFVTSYVSREGRTREYILRELSRVRATSTPDAWHRFKSHLEKLGEDYGYYERDPLASEIAKTYMKWLIREESTLSGLEHLRQALKLQAEGRRVMIVGNHLSYIDTMSLCELLRRHDQSGVAESIVAVAGPKVYSEPMRRLAVAGIHSIKVAQSSRLSTNTTELSPREIARITRSAIQAGKGAMDRGDMVLIYPEGTRSRSGHLQPFVRATHRWLNIPGLVIVPFVIWGLDSLYEVDCESLSPAAATARFGPILDVDSVRKQCAGDRTEILRRAHHSLASLLPLRHRPLPGLPTVE